VRDGAAHPHHNQTARDSSEQDFGSRFLPFLVHSRCLVNPSASVLERRALDLLRPLVTDSCQRCRIPQGKAFTPEGEYRVAHRIARGKDGLRTRRCAGGAG